MPETDSLLDPRFTLIAWNPASSKWQDGPSNDVWCSDRLGNGWRMTARRGFEDGRGEIAFGGKYEALQFYVNYLFGRRMAQTTGEPNPGTGLIDRRYEVLSWDAAQSKWNDMSGNLFMRDMGGYWRVGGRHGFEDGRSVLDFDDEIEAFEFLVNHLYGRMMNHLENPLAA